MDGSIFFGREARCELRIQSRIVKLTPELLRVVAAFERDPLISEMFADKSYAEFACNDWAYALLKGADVLAAAGLILRCIGRAEAWLLVSKEARMRDLVPAVRTARRMMDDRQRRPMFRRIECHVREAAPWRKTFMAALGFTLEGVHPAWDELGRTYCSYGRIAKENG